VNQAEVEAYHRATSRPEFAYVVRGPLVLHRTRVLTGVAKRFDDPLARYARPNPCRFAFGEACTMATAVSAHPRAR